MSAPYRDRAPASTLKLTAQEEATLWTQYCQTDDPEALTQLLQSQYQRTYWLIGQHLRTHPEHKRDVEELFSSAKTELLLAMQSKKFDPARARFFTSCAKKLRGVVANHFRTICNIVYPPHKLPAVRHPDDIAFEALPGEGPSVEEQVDQHLLEEKMQKILTDAEHQILTMAIIDGYTTRQIADVMQWSPSSVGEAYHRALKKMRWALAPLRDCQTAGQIFRDLL